MSLIKLAYKSANEINSDYEDKRSLWRRAKGKLLTYPLVFSGPLAPILGHYLDRRRKEKDFKENPKKFEKK